MNRLIPLKRYEEAENPDDTSTTDLSIKLETGTDYAIANTYDPDYEERVRARNEHADSISKASISKDTEFNPNFLLNEQIKEKKKSNVFHAIKNLKNRNVCRKMLNGRR